MERAFAFATSLFSASTLTKKASLNSLAAGVDYCARFAMSFLVTPLLIGGLGDALYGIWVVILKMTDYLSAGGRSSQALKWFVVQRQESENFAEKRQGVGGAVVAWIFFLPLQLSIGGVVAWYLPVWLDVTPALFATVRIAALVVAASLILRGFVGIPESVLLGENLGYKRIWISAPLVVVGGGLTILAVHLNLGLVGVAGAMLASVFLTGLTFVVVVKRNVPWFGSGIPDRETVRQFVGLSWWFTLWELIARVMMAADVVLLGILASPEVVAVYAVIRFLPEGILRFLTVLVFETIPGIGKILAGGELDRAAKMRGEVLLLTWLATTSVGATILLWNNTFVELWVGPQYAVDYLPMFLMVVMVFQFVWIQADADFINLSLDLKHKVLLGAISTAVSIVLAVLFIRSFENAINGVCLGIICGRTILSIGYPMILGIVFKTSFLSQISGLVRPGIVTGLLFTLSARLCAEVDVNSWPSLAVLGASSFSVIGVSAFVMGLNAARRNLVMDRLRQIISRVGA